MSTKVLNDGVPIPVIGLGLWKAQSTGNPKSVVATAIQCGYRLFDGATIYENEEELGQALKESGLKRNEYFVITKLPDFGHGYDEARREFHASLQRLGLDFLDLYLVHSTSGGRNIETWRALVDLQKEGKIRSIGVSNFNVHHLEGLAKAKLPLPSVNQFELHPWHQQREVADYCNEKGIAIMAFAPLARCVRFESCPVLDSMVAKYERTKAQLLIRWSIQKGYICIPKSSLIERQRENISVFDFQLDEEDVEKLNDLDCGMRLSNRTLDLPWEG